MLGKSNIIAFVPTNDATRAKEFYEKTLGLRFVSDDKFALVFDANGIMIRIARAGSFKPAPFTILGWQTNDIDADVPRLKKRGVTFEQFGMPGQAESGIWTAPTGDKVAWFKDPDGNVLSISQHV